MRETRRACRSCVWGGSGVEVGRGVAYDRSEHAVFGSFAMLLCTSLLLKLSATLML